MEFSKNNIDIWVPDGISFEQACSRITHLCIGAHEDDPEIMAFSAISHCYEDDNEWFGCIICSDGARSPRQGKYLALTAAELIAQRREEQRKVAELGRYGVVLQLGYTTAETRDPANNQLTKQLQELIALCRPRIIYTHCPTDKHKTHVGVFWAALAAIRALPNDLRPQFLYGCEVWRDLDWLTDAEKLKFDVSSRAKLGQSLVGVYESQIGSGKQYDLATVGRRQAHATFFDPYTSDGAEQVELGMDLTPLIKDDKLDAVEFSLGFIESFKNEVKETLVALRRA